MSKQKYHMTIVIDGKAEDIMKNLQTVHDTAQKILAVIAKSDEVGSAAMSGDGYQCTISPKHNAPGEM
jgi:hypothetical protein